MDYKITYTYKDKEDAILLQDMNNILDHMDLLNELDTDNVDELVNVHDMTSPLRDDTFEDSLDKDSVIENSPESSKDYIEVPLVLKKESQ